MDVLLVIIALIIVVRWASSGLQKAGAWLCEVGQNLSECSAVYKSKSVTSKNTMGGQDELYLQQVREEVRRLTDSY